MRKLLLALLIAMTALAGAARAQFCPGAAPYVFTDVPANDSFCSNITWMAATGVTTGCQVIDANNRLYCPDDFVTRKQMSAFMFRLDRAIMPSTCSVGQTIKWSGLDWGCANDDQGGSAGTITSVSAGTGLQAIPNPITVSGGIGIAPTYQLPQGCTANQVPKWTGVAWTCAADVFGTGTLTSLIQGAGIELTPSPITSSGTIAVAVDGITTAALANDAVTTSKIANGNVTFTKLAGTGCTHGQVLKYMNSAWGCAADNEAIATTLAASFVRKRATVPSARNLASQQNLCATDPIAAVDYPRSALVRGMVNLYTPDGSMDIMAWIVYSTDGGATWTTPATNDGSAYGTLYSGQTPPDDISLYPMNVITLDMGSSYRFALAAMRYAGAGAIASTYCENLVQLLIPSGVSPSLSAEVASDERGGGRQAVLQGPVQAKDAEVAALKKELADLRLAVEVLMVRTASEGRVAQTR